MICSPSASVSPRAKSGVSAHLSLMFRVTALSPQIPSPPVLTLGCTVEPPGSFKKMPCRAAGCPLTAVLLLQAARTPASLSPSSPLRPLPPHHLLRLPEDMRG